MPTSKSSSDLSNITNYRSISLSSLIPKIFESLVANKIVCDLSYIIIGSQHDFLRNKRTVLVPNYFSKLCTGEALT